MINKRLISISALLICFFSLVEAQGFTKFFTDQSCRVDLTFAGNHSSTEVFLDKVHRESFWGGPKRLLTEDFVAGDFRFQVIDSASNKLIYRDGFNTLFREWQTTSEATRINRSFENTVLFPFPLATVELRVDKRTGYDKWEQLMSVFINPGDLLIRQRPAPRVPVKVIRMSAEPHLAVDVAIIAEGYTKKEMKLFYREAARLASYLCSHEPFMSYANKFNFYAIAAPSDDPDVSRPEEHRWKNTALGSHYYTFYSPRYLTSPEHYRIRDIASAVPYDAIYILANTDEYGGGGIYNFYALTSARGRTAREVTVHEFGHSFAGLADEYFYEQGDVLDGTYSTSEEPWEPNITTLVRFDTKWLAALPDGTEIPTALPEDEEGLKSTSELGVYEGAGYKTKGIYRPTPDCRMKTNAADSFCPVCSEAVKQRILMLTQSE